MADDAYSFATLVTDHFDRRMEDLKGHLDEKMGWLGGRADEDRLRLDQLLAEGREHHIKLHKIETTLGSVSDWTAAHQVYHDRHKTLPEVAAATGRFLLGNAWVRRGLFTLLVLLLSAVGLHGWLGVFENGRITLQLPAMAGSAQGASVGSDPLGATAHEPAGRRRQ